MWWCSSCSFNFHSCMLTWIDGVVDTCLLAVGQTFVTHTYSWRNFPVVLSHKGITSKVHLQIETVRICTRVLGWVWGISGPWGLTKRRGEGGHERLEVTAEILRSALRNLKSVIQEVILFNLTVNSHLAPPPGPRTPLCFAGCFSCAEAAASASRAAPLRRRPLQRFGLARPQGFVWGRRRLWAAEPNRVFSKLW